jgi:hypothetical protein
MQSKSMQPPVSTSREALRCLLVGLHVSRTFSRVPELQTGQKDVRVFSFKPKRKHRYTSSFVNSPSSMPNRR